MKILGQVISVEPLALIVSLPNQLLAHVPITNITSQFTHLLEAMDDEEDGVPSDESDDEEEGSGRKPRIPDLVEMFRPGLYVRAVVAAVHAQGSTDVTGFSRTRDESHKASRRVELSLFPEKVNEGVAKTDVKAGFVGNHPTLHGPDANGVMQSCSASIKSVEDHGYILDMGVQDISGFLSFKDAQQAPHLGERRLSIGHLLDVSVTKLSSNGRTCNVTVNPESIRSAFVSCTHHILFATFNTTM